MSQELVEALAAWRADRSSVARATAVDDAAARSERPVPPRKKPHRWWIAQAREYDPVTVTALLEHLRWDARGRDWQNLFDRIEHMLAWPDDPRVARSLAELLFDEPFTYRGGVKHRWRHPEDARVRAAIARRVAEIGDLRAIVRVASAWQLLEQSSRAPLADAAMRAPLPRAVAAPDPRLDELWAFVVEEPQSLDRRLVLADALSERGDPRGELIALQCAPLVEIEKARARGEPFDPSGMFGAHADAVAALIRAHWDRWLGEVALGVDRSSRFWGGLLGDVNLAPIAPPWLWDRIAGHRELCTIHRLRRSGLPASIYARFVSRLVRPPQWMEIDEEVVAELAALRPVRLIGVRFDGVPRPPTLRDLLAFAPGIERLDFGPVDGGELALVRDLAAPLRIEVHVSCLTFPDPAIFEELRAMPHVTVRFGR